MPTIYTPHQKKYFAQQLSLLRPAREIESVASSISGVRVDFNPHQVDAALFALRSPISRGALLADEVGLGKTIEAGLVIAQYWAERKKQILLILPASLRMQWKSELEEKFHVDCSIIERPKKTKGTRLSNPFKTAADNKQVAICSYEFASKNKHNISEVPWDLVVLDEAHRLRNIYKKSGNTIARNIKESIEGRKKLLLTATPLQNNIQELYGLSTIIDDHFFGDGRVFVQSVKDDPSTIRKRLESFCIRTLRKNVAEAGYIKFTQRKVMTRPYSPTDDEQQLYDLITEYLQSETAKALPDNGRPLITIVIRKLLASSTVAVKNTMQALIEKLELLEQGYEDNLASDLAEDFEGYVTYDEEFGEDEDDYLFEELQQADLQLIQEEKQTLQTIITLADRIQRDAKSDELLLALEAGFGAVAESKGKQKAVIFTESIRTQKYILQLLESNGYQDQVVLLNGTNTDDISKQIYADWKERHKTDGQISGSRTADMKAAIVEEFRERRTILIGTESAAEGINLQFCNMVVNYDLPWNPQRVEQRIGRCHRYGQTHDVIVINFVNQKNAADKRVYELLDQKFKLFEGVFGSSDKVLGILEKGIDFERAVYNIVQNCRTDQEINQQFDDLQTKYAQEIKERKAEVTRELLEHFDEDVVNKLKNVEERARHSLEQFDRWKYNLFVTHGATPVTTEDGSWLFSYEGQVYLPSWEQSRHTTGEGLFLDADSQIYTELLTTAMNEQPQVATLAFQHSSLPVAEQVSFFQEHKGLDGFVSIDKLTHSYGNSGDQEEHLLVSIITSSGVDLDIKLFERMMEIPAQVTGQAILDGQLTLIIEQNKQQQKTEIETYSKETLLERYQELDNWVADREAALDIEIQDIQSTIRLKKGEQQSNVAGLTFDEIVALGDEINKLERDLNRKKRQKFEREDEISKEADQERKRTVGNMRGTEAFENVMAFRFEVV